MTDLEKRLRYEATGREVFSPICQEAADEIERLRALLNGVEIALARDESIDGAMKLIVDAKIDHQQQWPEVTKAQVERIDALVAPEFATGDWQTVECETGDVQQKEGGK